MDGKHDADSAYAHSLKRKVHDTCLEERAKAAWHEPGTLCVIQNPEYRNHMDGKVYELDLLVLKTNGKVNIEEIKCSDKCMSKAKEQMLRARRAFQSYDPRVAVYIHRSAMNDDHSARYRFEWGLNEWLYKGDH